MSNQGYGRNPLWAPEYTQRKPSFNDMGAMRLNPDNPLNQGLVAWWLMNEGAGIANGIIEKISLPVTNSSWAISSRGGGLKFDDTGENTHTATTNGLKNPYPITISCLIYVFGTIPVYTGIFGVSYDYPRNQDVIGIWYGPNGFYCNRLSYSTEGQLFTTQTADSGNYYHICASIKSGSQDLYINTIKTSASSPLNDPLYAASSVVYSGDLSGSRTPNFTIIDAKIYKRYLSTPEVLSEYLNPYGTPDNPRFLVMPQRTWFVPSVGAGTTYDLDFDGASSASQVAAIAISAIREITISNASSSSSISALVLETIHQLGLENTVAASQISALALSTVRQLALASASSDSQVSGLALSAIRELALSDASSGSGVAAIAMSAVRELALTGVSSDSQVAATALSVLHQLGIEDAAIDSQVTALAISIIHALEMSDISAATQIIDVAMSVSGEFSIDGLAAMSDSEVTELVMSKIAQLGITDASISSAVVSIMLAILRQLSPLIDAATASSVESVVMQAIRGLNSQAISVASAVAEIAISAIRRLEAIGITSATEISAVMMSALRPLGIAGLSSSSVVTSIALMIGGLALLSGSGISADSTVGLAILGLALPASPFTSAPRYTPKRSAVPVLQRTATFMDVKRSVRIQ